MSAEKLIKGTAEGYKDVYEFVYNDSKKNIDICKKFGKDHNLWIQTYKNPMGSEEDIIAAADAIYDAGGRTIFTWGYRGSDANDYRAENPDATWYVTKAALERLSERFRNELHEKYRKDIR